MPAGMTCDRLMGNLQAAQSLADLQHKSAVGPTFSTYTVLLDLGSSAPNRISPEDLQVFREKFPHLNDFSTAFLQSRTLEELLRIESTSLRIKEAERARDIEDRLANNKTSLPFKSYEVQVGRENRWNCLHPARFLPSATCSAQKQFTGAREVIGLSSPPQLACNDMTTVGMGGFVTQRGWYEMGSMGSCKMKFSMFNINSATKSSTFKTPDSEAAPEMKDISEFTVALRAMRIAAHFVQP
jgi:hypothetical protein